MKIFYSMMALSALGGCAAQITSSTPRQVIIDARVSSRAGISGGEAQKMADSECKKHGRFARMTGRPMQGVSTEYVFDCVE